jgi:ABC-type transport system involved in cytochrome bd biosynthesis fused ATPase/permease subunit
MFRIGVMELALTCGLLFLVLVIPVIVARYYARVDERLKNIENKIDKKE